MGKTLSRNLCELKSHPLNSSAATSNAPSRWPSPTAATRSSSRQTGPSGERFKFWNSRQNSFIIFPENDVHHPFKVWQLLVLPVPEPGDHGGVPAGNGGRICGAGTDLWLKSLKNVLNFHAQSTHSNPLNGSASGPAKCWTNKRIGPLTTTFYYFHTKMGYTKAWTNNQNEPLSGDPSSGLDCFKIDLRVS